MSEIAADPILDQPAKKRKRSGKERQQRKAEAIAAAAAAAEAGTDGLVSGKTAAVSGSKTDGDSTEDMTNKAAAMDGDMEVEQDGETAKDGETEPVEDVFDISKVQGRIQQGLKSMLPVLKRAKTSETQRLIKKVKFLRKKAEDGGDAAQSAKQEVLDLEQQLDIIKRLELSTLVQPLLSLKLRKHPRLKQFLPLPPDFFPESTKSPAASSTLQIKVENRLYSSKPTSDAIAAVVNWVVGEDGASLKYAHNKGVNAANKAKNASASKSELGLATTLTDDVDMDSDGDEDDAEGPGAPEKDDQAEEEQVAVHKMREQVAAEEMAAEAAGWESGSLAGDDEEDDGDDDSDGDDLSDGNDSDDSGAIDWDAPEWAGLPAGDGSDGSSDEAEVKPSGKTASTSETPVKAAVKPSATPTKKKDKASEPVADKAKPVRASTATITSSMFLPSLNTGYTLGEYDSDPDEDDRRDNKRQGLNPNGERKNRRGQRERRLIAEKKYGSGANHVKKAAQSVEGAAKANQARQFLQNQGGAGTREGGKWSKGAAGDQGWGGRQPGSTPTAQPRAEPAVTSARPAAPTKPVEKVTDKPAKAEHPSWEAARLRKQKESQMASAALSGGGQAAKPKKIVFD